jgi:hypothetical protein
MLPMRAKFFNPNLTWLMTECKIAPQAEKIFRQPGNHQLMKRDRGVDEKYSNLLFTDGKHQEDC